MTMADFSRRARASARLLFVLAFGAGQAVFAAHLHEIKAPARASAIRRADAHAAETACPLCQLAVQARVAGASPAAAPRSFLSNVLVAAVSSTRPACRRSLRAAARAPPSYL